MPLVNQYQIEIVRAALWWAGRGCREVKSSNGGSCIDDLHRRYGAFEREAYCAKLAWVVAEEAARAAGIKNPLPKTAGACDMLQRSVARGLRVDKQPAIGAIAYHGSDPRFSTGHIAVVVGVTSTTMRTVEGNNDDRIDDWTYPLQKVKSRARTQACQRGVGWDFIHIEDAGGTPSMAIDGVAAVSEAPSPVAVAAAIGAIVTGYAVMRALSA